MAVWKKRPNEVKQFTFDFAPLTNGRSGAKSDLLASGETISDSTVTGDTGITVDSYGQTDSNTSVTTMLSSGTVNNSYTITCTITTSSGQTLIREQEIQVVPRYT